MLRYSRICIVKKLMPSHAFSLAREPKPSLAANFSSSPSFPSSVRIVEVGPRDGLQNEKNVVSADTKLVLIDKLYKAGLRSIEGGAFVSPKWVPQMANSNKVFETLQQRNREGLYPGASFSALTPNMKGLRLNFMYQ